MHDMLKRLNDKFFEGELENGYPSAIGTYRFANGTIYHGKMTEGMMDGEGTLSFPRGGKFVASWKMGKLVTGSYFYDDDLEYKTEAWTYCSDSDRRFWTEVQNGIKLSDRPQITDREPKRWIPQGTYDLGDSYYDPKDGNSYFYNGEFFRSSPGLEAEWAATKCRIGADESGGDDDSEEDEDEARGGDSMAPMAGNDRNEAGTRDQTRGTTATSMASRPYTACPGSMVPSRISRPVSFLQYYY